VFNYPQTFPTGSSSLPESPVWRALISFSNCASNFALSLSHPLKSAIIRDVTTDFFPFSPPFRTYPSRSTGIKDRIFCFLSFLSFFSFWIALSSSSSTHPLFKEFLEQQRITLSQIRIPRSIWSKRSSPGRT